MAATVGVCDRQSCWGMKRMAQLADREILSVRDVAGILEVEEQTIDAMVQSGDLLAFKVWGQWRIRRIDFDTWMADQAAVSDEPVDEEG